MADDVALKDANDAPFDVATRDKGGREVQLVQIDLGNGSTVSPAEGTLPVSGTVAVSNFPATQPVSAASLPLPAGASTAANQATANAALDDILAALSATLAVGGTVSISNLPATQPVSGTVAVSNFPGTQPVSGPLTDDELRAAAVPVSGTFWQATQPVSAAALPLPAGAATEATIAALDGKLPALATRPLDNASPGQPVRPIGQEVWNVSFADSGASVLASEFITPIVGSGITYNQTSSALNILTGTATNAEFLTRSLVAWRGAMRAKFGITASQRIVNNNFAVLLADLVGSGLAFTINSATSVTVTAPGHAFTALSVGQFVNLAGIVGAAGVPGRYAIASVVAGTSITFTVAGWPASGSGTLTLFGHSYVRNLFTGATATVMNFDAQRRGWASNDTAATIRTTAAPGVVIHNELTGRECFALDQLRASVVTPGAAAVASRIENIPDDNLDLYVWIWNFNGTTAPASTTTFALQFISVEKFANTPVYLQGLRTNGAINPLPVQTQGTVPVSLATNTPALAAGTNRAAFLAGAAIWFDDSSTNLASNATFTGTSRDLTVTATATAMANAATYAQELVVSAESDVTGTLWLEVSRDNTNWRRIKSLATTAVTGGGFYAEIVHRPSWRYARVGFTNGAGAQARFTINSILKAI
jgi:hypothetical protein